jgi:2-oxoglutarate ferredoxin oxidoreductase subunit alpha
LETVWPFPEALIRDVATRARVLIMPEINAGQMVLELERCAGGACPVQLVSHLGGSVIHPAAILDAMKNYEKKKKGSAQKKSSLRK